MITFYKPVFTLEVFHSFYSDNLCKALSFEPTASCWSLLNEYRMIFKNSQSGFVVIGEKKKTGTVASPIFEPKIDILKGTKFHFLIRQTRNDFLNITNADMNLLKEGKKFYLRNTSSNPVVISGSIATVNIHNSLPLTNVLQPGSVNFMAPVHLSEDPVKLVLIDGEGNFLIERKVPRDSNNNISAERILISKAPFAEGIYTLQQVNGAGVVTSSQTYFLSDPGVVWDVAGIMIIDYEAILSAHTDKEIRFEVQLSNRSIRWIYQIEIEKYTDPAESGFTYNSSHLFLNDTANNVPAVSSVFTKSVIAPANPQDNQKVRFRSDTEIDLREEPYKEVKLINSGIADPIIDNLPNPDPLMMRDDGSGSYEAEMFLKIR